MSQKYSQDEAQALVKALKEGNQLAFSICIQDVCGADLFFGI